MNKKLGVKANEGQRETSIIVKGIQVGAIDDLSMIRTRMESGYRNDKARLDVLMDLLRFRSYWKKAQGGNQNALLEQLFAFDNHTGSELRAELEANGVPAYRIDSVKAYADKLEAANVTQETLKGNTPGITAGMTAELNNIYDAAMDICNTGKKIFRKDQMKRELFNFTRLAAQQVSAGKTKIVTGDE